MIVQHCLRSVYRSRPLIVCCAGKYIIVLKLSVLRYASIRFASDVFSLLVRNTSKTEYVFRKTFRMMSHMTRKNEKTWNEFFRSACPCLGELPTGRLIDAIKTFSEQTDDKVQKKRRDRKPVKQTYNAANLQIEPLIYTTLHCTSVAVAETLPCTQSSWVLPRIFNKKISLWN